MSEDRQTYEIAKIEDFFSVPRDRRALMLHELGLWMDMHDRMDDLKNDPDFPAGLVITGKRAAFNWIDDDKGQAVFNLTAIGPLAQEPNA